MTEWGGTEGPPLERVGSYEPPINFVGPCTCDHAREIHGWGGCDVEDCDCEAGWEE